VKSHRVSLALFVAALVAGSIGSMLATRVRAEDESGRVAETWEQFVESWKEFVKAKENGTIVEDDGLWKDLCYADEKGNQYTYDNVSLSDLPEDMKRWLVFEGSMPDDIRQLFLTRYYLYMTDDERNAVRSVITSAEFLDRYLNLPEEEKKAVWDSIIWDKTVPS